MKRWLMIATATVALGTACALPSPAQPAAAIHRPAATAAMAAVAQPQANPQEGYAQREAEARDLESFEGGAVGLIAAVLIVILVLLLI